MCAFYRVLSEWSCLLIEIFSLWLYDVTKIEKFEYKFENLSEVDQTRAYEELVNNSVGVKTRLDQ